jgi:D-arabinose 1-dehydrogenase-like Zn-dependent alcohol dehydrogenase
MAAKMKVVQVVEPGGKLELAERPIPEPRPGEVRIRIDACGVCHSDALVKDGAFPGLRYPAVPGHEVAGTVDAVGSGVEIWRPGQRVGVGWYGGHCGRCAPCRRGDFISCLYLKVPGIAYDGGYAEYMAAPSDALALIPDELSAVDAAPLLCAGITTFNALRHSGALPGDLVAVLGIGGLGHLALQFAAKSGFETVAVGRGKDKEELARKLGAGRYLDSSAVDPAAELARLGGAKVILATAPSSKAMSALIDGLGIDGKLVTPLQLISARRSVQGWPSGTAADSEAALKFSARTGIRPMIETFPLARAAEGYERMITGKARFRVVLLPREGAAA